MEPLALFRTLAVHLPLAEAMRPLGAHLLSRRSGLDALAREVVIARVCARHHCGYEWGVHVVAFGATAGLTREQVADTASTAVDPSLWGDREQALLALTDELLDTGRVTDRTWQALGEHVTQQQALTLLVLVGWYSVISFVANGAQVPAEPWAARLPS
jgi:alkylhydroperoxidase family enzyme